jgi:hypothetical protein
MVPPNQQLKSPKWPLWLSQSKFLLPLRLLSKLSSLLKPKKMNRKMMNPLLTLFRKSIRLSKRSTVQIRKRKLQ